MPEFEFVFYWDEVIVTVTGRSREEAWAKVDRQRYDSPHLTIDSLVWAGYKNGFSFGEN